jgi:8-oxo-dGTP pyrophosphatase MutT (NUDIX family)
MHIALEALITGPGFLPPGACQPPRSVVKIIMMVSILACLRDRLPLELTLPDLTPDLVAAGVLVPLFLREGEVQVLFTQRTLLVKDHRGQIAFPGGVRDPEDPHLLATALRETQEEIGLAPEAVEVLGTLTAVNTLTGYHITPFVGLIPHPYHFRPSPREVKRLLVLPVREFYPPARWGVGSYTFQGRTARVCYWRNGQEVVWGATARILLNLLAYLGAHPVLEDLDGACQD